MEMKIETQIIQVTNDLNIRFITENDIKWFSVNDICKILQLKNPRAKIQKIDNTKKLLQSKGGLQNTSVINIQGVEQLLKTTRSSKSCLIFNKLNNLDESLIKKFKEESIVQKIDINTKLSIRYFSKNNEPWFVAKDICKILEIINTTDALKNFPNKWKKITTIEGNGLRKTNIINVMGLKKLLQSARSNNVSLIIDKLNIFNINFDIIFMCKETSCLRVVSSALQRFPHQFQYRVGKYRIDLYFTQNNIAVECDENGHKNRDKKNEEERQNYIEDKLKCTFIRFNPNSKNFNIGDVINKILELILELILEPTVTILEPTVTILEPTIVFPIEKECNECKESKPLEDFYKDKCAPDGYMRKCKKCVLELRKKSKNKIVRTEKNCTRCKETKLIDDFYKKSSSRDGYSIYCKICKREKERNMYAKKKKE